MFATNGQGYAFIVCAAAGVVIGIVYDVFYICRASFKHHIIATIAFDIAFSVAAFFVAAWSFYSYLLDFRLYVFVGFVIGFIFEHISIGYLIAKTTVFVYNRSKKTVGGQDEPKPNGKTS